MKGGDRKERERKRKKRWVQRNEYGDKHSMNGIFSIHVVSRVEALNLCLFTGCHTDDFCYGEKREKIFIITEIRIQQRLTEKNPASYSNGISKTTHLAPLR